MAVVLKLQHAQNHLEDLSKHRLVGATPRISDTGDPRRGVWDCISSKFPGDAAATAALKTTCGESLSQDISMQIHDSKYHRALLRK